MAESTPIQNSSAQCPVEYVDKKNILLTKRPMLEADVEIPGLTTVRVRGLTRAEVFDMQGKVKTVGDIECRMLEQGMIDPKMTFDEVKEWSESSPAGNLDHVVNEIMRLSGMGSGDAKEAMKLFRK